MLKVKFVADAELKHGDGTVEFSASAGEIHELRDDQAHRWIKRNKAVLYTEGDELADLEAEEQKEHEALLVDEQEAKPKGKKSNRK